MRPLAPSPARRRSDLRRGQAIAGFIFIAPSFLLYLTFVLVPALVTIYLSLTYYDIINSPIWVGIENYQDLWRNPRTVRIFTNTLAFTFLAVIGNNLAGLLLALLINRRMPRFLAWLFRLSFFLPVMIATAFAAIVWSFFYSEDFGVLNYYLRLLGLPGVRWLSDGRIALYSIVIMDVWKNCGFFMIIYLAALQGIPRDVKDAVLVDGASPTFAFFKITLPYISPVILFNLVYATFGALQVYESVKILTNGGPGDATRSASMLIMDQAFGAFEIGYAASVSVVLLVLVLVCAVIQFWTSKTWVRY